MEPIYDNAGVDLGYPDESRVDAAEWELRYVDRAGLDRALGLSLAEM
jgi:hypothetical protein